MQKIEAHILIVDDSDEVLVALGMLLERHFSKVTRVSIPDRIHDLLDSNEIDLVILDMNFSAKITSGNEGIFWMREVHKKEPGLPVVFITAYGDIDLAVMAMKEGAMDFITKPWDNEKVVSTVRNAVEIRQSRGKIKQLRQKQKMLSEEVRQHYDFFKGDSPAMTEVMNRIGKIAATAANVLILGENGSGKELIAREIHRASERADEIFVTVDLGSITETLFESELFGHVKGAFTDAVSDRTGRFEVASGGTLFLDEIGNLSMAMQTKLLSTLQNQIIYRVGSTKPLAVDVRVICATNQPLKEMIANNQFREDLYYRINTIEIKVPPLRNRKEDIPLLAKHFMIKYCGKYKKKELAIDPVAFDLLLRYTWPGNIREFEHVIERAVILAESGTIRLSDLELTEIAHTHLDRRQSWDLAENEKRLIEMALATFNGNLSTTARELGVTRATLYRKINQYKI